MSLAIKLQNLLMDEELSNRYFGEYNQVSVLGYFKDGPVNRYVIHCDECSKDIDLFGQGNFVTTKRTLLRGGLPCGCSNHVTWSKEQYEVLCRRKAVSLGYVFIGFSDEWKRKHTKITLSCKDHGTWATNSVGSLLYASNGCPSCRTEALRATRIKSDEDMIDSFFASGAFHIDTKFWRSGRKDSEGKKKFWNTQRIAIFGGGSALLAFIVYQLFFSDKRSKLNVEAEIKTDKIYNNPVESHIIPTSSSGNGQIKFTIKN